MSDPFAPPSGSAAPMPPPPGTPFAPPPTGGAPEGRPSSVFIDHDAIRAIRSGTPLPPPASRASSAFTEEPGRRRRRRRVWPWLTLAGLVAVVGAVVAWRSTGDTTTEAFPEAIDLSTLQPDLAARLIFDEPPPGAKLSFAIDWSDGFDGGFDGGFDDGPEPGPSVFYAAPGASLDEGRWVAVATERIETDVEADNSDDSDDFPDGDSETVEINGLQGKYVAKPAFVASHQSQVVFGPLNGHQVVVVAVGLSRDELLDVAAGVRLDSNGIGLRGGGALAGFERRHFDLLWIGQWVGEVLFAKAELTVSMYGELGNDLVVFTRLADPATFDDRWTFAMTDEKAVVVRGTSGWMGWSRLGGGSDEPEMMLVWNEGGREVAISIREDSAITTEQVLAAAETLREATDAEWEDVNQLDDVQVGIEDDEELVEEAAPLELVIGEGTFPDSMTWTVTLSDHDGDVLLAVRMAGDSSESTSESSVLDVPNIQFETIDGDKTVVAATAPTDIDSAKLVVTLPSGQTLQVPLVSAIGLDLLAGAIGIDGTDFAAEIIDGDGNVLTTAGTALLGS